MDGFFLKTGDNYKVSLKDVFEHNRSKVVSSLPDGCLMYLEGGESAERFDSDHEPIFRQESYFWWMSGVKEPDVCLAIDTTTAETTLFIPKLPESYATIMGHIKTPEQWKEIYQVNHVKYKDQIHQFMLDWFQKQDSANTKLLLMEGTNSDSGSTYNPPSPSSFPPSLSHLVDSSILFPILSEARVLKSPAELLLLRHVTEVTSFAHVYTMRNCHAGKMYEYQCESLFRHYCYYNYGCRLVGYTPICGCGPNAAVLHYGHTGEPNERLIQDGDMCLFDMGAEYQCYGSDVTCSFPANGKFTPQQRGIFQAVLNAQKAVYRMIKPGVSWVDCHKAAEAAILRQLIEIGLVVLPTKNQTPTTIDDLVEMRLGAVFMPHGLGHFIGIDTHDVGGYLKGIHPQRIQQPGLSKLRTARNLKENMVLTVEPGCYFIDHLLDQALNGDVSQYLNKDKINQYRGFGGVRLEDVVVITSDGFVNYTLCPRTIDEIEYVMSGGKWPPLRDEAPELGRERLTDPTPLPAPPSL